MILRRIADAIRRQDWFVVVLEIFIVVVGIFIGLQVDDWNEARKDFAAEKIYLAELLEDFEADRESIDRTLMRANEIERTMIGLLNQSALPEPSWSVEELNASFRLVQSMPTFIPVRRAYDNLASSGDLRLLRSRELKNALSLYYARAELVDLIQGTHEAELVETFQPYIIENLDYQAVGLIRAEGAPLPPPVDVDRILDVLATPKFRNIATQKWTIINDLRTDWEEQKDRNEQVITLVKAELAGSNR